MLTKDTADGVAVVAVVVVLPIHVATVEVQVVGVLPIISVKRTRPIVTVIAYVFDTAIVTVASSREL